MKRNGRIEKIRTAALFAAVTALGPSAKVSEVESAGVWKGNQPALSVALGAGQWASVSVLCQVTVSPAVTVAVWGANTAGWLGVGVGFFLISIVCVDIGSLLEVGQYPWR